MQQFIKSVQKLAGIDLQCEAEGLQAMADVINRLQLGGIRTPQVFGVNEQVLTLEKIVTQAGEKSQWQQLGEQLALVHLQPKSQFGWHCNNFIGLGIQTNEWRDSWGDFFVDFRLESMIDQLDNGKVRVQFQQHLKRHKNRLIEYLNTQCQLPSLLHGDLWQGNVLFDAQSAVLIDPAVYCGHSEADIAMTELFGGFHSAFYEGYQGVNPLSVNYPLNRDIYNLYHALNHYQLFGSSYLRLCEAGFSAIAKV